MRVIEEQMNFCPVCCGNRLHVLSKRDSVRVGFVVSETCCLTCCHIILLTGSERPARRQLLLFHVLKGN